MLECCVCDQPAFWKMSGAAICGKDHGAAFYNALLPSEREASLAGATLSDRTVRYCKLDAFNLSDARTAIRLTDKYTNLTLVGGGALGSFYQADVIGQNTRVFLHIFSPDDPISDVKREFSNVLKLRRELEQHHQGSRLVEHLPEIYDAFFAVVPNYRSVTYVVSMEHIPGIAIGDYVHTMRKRGTTIGYRAWLRLFHDAFSLLEAMNTIKFVHGNLNGWDIFVRQPSTDMESLYAQFVLLDFRASCVDNCAKLYSGRIEYMSRDLVGFPFDSKTRRWLDGMSPENRLNVFSLEDVYAMATVLFNVLAGVSISPLQRHILAVDAKYAGTVPPDNVNYIDEVNAKRRAEMQKLFAASKHRDNIDTLIDSNTSGLSDMQKDVIDELYMKTIGAPLGRRSTAAELRELAYGYLNLKQ